MKKWGGRLLAGALLVVVTVHAAGPVSANPWPWATVDVGETKTLPSPEQACSGPWQIDFGAQFVEIVQSTPQAVTVRGTAVSDGPMKLRCLTVPAPGKPPYTQSLWLQVFAAPPVVVPEGPFPALLPLSAVALVGAAAMAWRARGREARASG